VVKFRKFYNKYKEMLFAYLMRRTGDYYLSGDIMQESFTRYLDRYGDRNHSAPLLFRIARNALLDDQRKAQRSTSLAEEDEPDGKNPEHQMLVRDEYRRVLAAMQQLGEAERDVLSLAVSSDLSYRDIAELTGTSEQNIKVRVHRARVKLRTILDQGDKNEGLYDQHVHR
jgi:RNA polymerase sigma-70 factor (ECF subfamily)